MKQKQLNTDVCEFVAGQAKNNSKKKKQNNLHIYWTRDLTFVSEYVTERKT